MGVNYGHRVSEETRKKISESLIGHHVSEETRRKIGEASRKRKHCKLTQEAKDRISAARKGMKASAETRRKMAESAKARGIPPEVRKKMAATRSIRQLGKPLSLDTRKKMSAVRKGRHRPELVGKLAREKNPNWRGGTSSARSLHGTTLRWIEISHQIRMRDYWTCQNCGKDHSKEVHHKIPWRISKNDSPNNLVTLCASCHRTIESIWQRVVEPYYSSLSKI